MATRKSEGGAGAEGAAPISGAKLWGKVQHNRALKIMVKFRAGVRVKEAVLDAAMVPPSNRTVRQVSEPAPPRQWPTLHARRLHKRNRCEPLFALNGVTDAFCMVLTVGKCLMHGLLHTTPCTSLAVSHTAAQLTPGSRYVAPCRSRRCTNFCSR